MHFMIKEETFLISIIKFGEHFIKTRRFNSELLCNKKYKRWKQNQYKRKLSMFLYTSHIDWFNLKKNENYHLKVFLEKYHSFWWF